MKELERVIKKLERRKAPGPDNIPTEIIKELDEADKQEILKLMIFWWENKNIDPEEV